MTSTASQPIINTDLVLLDVDAGGDKQTVIGRLVSRLADAGRTHDTDGLIAAAMAREEQSATGLPGGIAIPHCRSPYVDTASIGFARLNPAVDFGAPDGPADLAFLIAAPEAGGAEHMKLLSSLARALVRKDFVESLRNATTPGEVVELVDGVVNATSRKAQARSRTGEGNAQDIGRRHRVPDRHRAHLHGRRLIGRRRQEGRVRRCTWRRRVRRAARRCRRRRSPRPTRSSSPPMSASRTSSGSQASPSSPPVSNARSTNPTRWSPKPSPPPTIRTPPAWRAGAGEPASRRRPPRRRATCGWGIRIRQILLTGVSYMIPFVAAGGLLIALGFLFAGYDIANKPEGEKRAARSRSWKHHCAHQLIDEPALRRFDRSTLERCCSPWAGWRSCSWSRRWPATSRSPSPTVPASHRGSPRARSRSSSAEASSAASSAV